MWGHKATVAPPPPPRCHLYRQMFNLMPSCAVSGLTCRIGRCAWPTHKLARASVLRACVAQPTPSAGRRLPRHCATYLRLCKSSHAQHLCTTAGERGGRCGRAADVTMDTSRDGAARAGRLSLGTSHTLGPGASVGGGVGVLTSPVLYGQRLGGGACAAAPPEADTFRLPAAAASGSCGEAPAPDGLERMKVTRTITGGSDGFLGARQSPPSALDLCAAATAAPAPAAPPRTGHDTRAPSPAFSSTPGALAVSGGPRVPGASPSSTADAPPGRPGCAATSAVETSTLGAEHVTRVAPASVVLPARAVPAHPPPLEQQAPHQHQPQQSQPNAPVGGVLEDGGTSDDGATWNSSRGPRLSSFDTADSTHTSASVSSASTFARSAYTGGSTRRHAAASSDSYAGMDHAELACHGIDILAAAASATSASSHSDSGSTSSRSPSPGATAGSVRRIGATGVRRRRQGGASRRRARLPSSSVRVKREPRAPSAHERLWQPPTTPIMRPADCPSSVPSLSPGAGAKPPSSRKSSPGSAGSQQRAKQFTSTFHGVSWHKRSQRWAVQIRHNGKRVHVGYFKEVSERSGCAAPPPVAVPLLEAARAGHGHPLLRARRS